MRIVAVVMPRTQAPAVEDFDGGRRGAAGAARGDRTRLIVCGGGRIIRSPRVPAFRPTPQPPPVTEPTATEPTATDSASASPPATGAASRRGWLAWTARGLYAACAAAVAWPAVRFFAAPLAAPVAGPVVDRAVRLADLAPGVPTLAPIAGESVDAWTRRPDQVVGRAWVLRTSPAGVDPPGVEVRAFSSVCPHAGCQVSGIAEESGDGAGALLCPCHGAAFALDGDRLPLPDGRPNPSPRGLDPLECELVEDEAGVWWVQVKYVRYRPGTPERIEV